MISLSPPVRLTHLRHRDRREMVFFICRETAANENHQSTKRTGFTRRVGLFFLIVVSRSGKRNLPPCPRVSNERSEWVVEKIEATRVAHFKGNANNILLPVVNDDCAIL